MFSFKRTAQLLAIMGALMVSVHGAGVLFFHCSSSTACVASVYFGVPGVTGSDSIPTSDMNLLAQSTAHITETGFALSDVHRMVQAVGTYVLLLGIVAMIVLEVRELKLLSRARMPAKR